MSNDTKNWSLLVGILAFTWVMGMLSGGHSCDRALKTLRQEAVERGYAEWRLTHAHNGETEFTWLEKTVPAEKEETP